MTKYKECKCDDEYWEEIVVQNDENYQYKNVIYFHCDDCGEDFRVEDFETGEVLNISDPPPGFKYKSEKFNQSHEEN